MLVNIYYCAIASILSPKIQPNLRKAEQLPIF